MVKSDNLNITTKYSSPDNNLSMFQSTSTKPTPCPSMVSRPVPYCRSPDLFSDNTTASDFLNSPTGLQQCYNYYADVYILIEAIESYEDLQQLRKIYDIWTTVKNKQALEGIANDHYESSTNSGGMFRGPNSPKAKLRVDVTPSVEKPSSPDSQEFLQKYEYKSEVNYEDLVRSLSGFARIVKYRSQITPSNLNAKLMSKNELEVLSVEEGFFRNGKKSGYCRTFNGLTGEVECGFFRNDLPSGKYVKWDGQE